MFPSPVKHKEFVLTPTVDTAIYAAGDAISVMTRLANAVRSSGGSGQIVRITVIDKSKQNAPIDLMFFDQSIANAVDNAAFNPLAADSLKAIATVVIGATDYKSLSAQAIATVAPNPPIQFRTNNSRDLWVQLVARGTPTFAVATDLQIKILIRYE